MPLRATWHTIKQNVPSPAWLRLPEQQRFCGCCSIRTGAAVVGWFDFVFNSLYIGMLLLAVTELRNLINNEMDLPPEFRDTTKNHDQFVGNVTLPQYDNSTEVVLHRAYDPDYVKAMIKDTLPFMYKTLCIPGIMIVFSVLWLITVEARDIRLVRLFGRAFILAIIVQLILQLALLIYVDVQIREGMNGGVSWIVWIIFVIYAILNVYFIPTLSEYIRRRIRETSQGMEQGLLTSEMYPRARVAEEYIQDAFTVEADVDMVQFQASLAKLPNGENKEEKAPDEPRDIYDEPRDIDNEPRDIGDDNDEYSPI